MLRVLVEGLPPDGASARAAAGHHWQAGDYHRADTRDLLELLFVAFCNANRAENTPAQPWPEPSWRPGDPLPDPPADPEVKRARAREAFEHIKRQVLPGER
jgi:hypothetical protein